MNTKKWKMKNGTKIRIKDMDDSHLTNTINFILRYAERRRACRSASYLICSMPQGDMAQMMVEQEMDAVWSASAEDFCPPIYEDMLEEFSKRSLDYSKLIDYNMALLGEEIKVITGRRED